MQEYCMYIVRTMAGKDICATSYTPQGFHDAITTAAVMAQVHGPCQFIRVRKVTLVEEVIVEMISPLCREN